VGGGDAGTWAMGVWVGPIAMRWLVAAPARWKFRDAGDVLVPVLKWLMAGSGGFATTLSAYVHTQLLEDERGKSPNVREPFLSPTRGYHCSSYLQPSTAWRCTVLYHERGNSEVTTR
jgi:hypothetical protein